MEIKVVLPKKVHKKTIRELLEEDWLIPRKVRHFLRVRQNVQVNGEIRRFHETVKAGDTITLTFEKDDYTRPQRQLGDAKKCVVLFEDEHLIVLDKPAGIKTHPNSPDETDTLLNHLAAYLAPSSTPYVVHRLDKETSGAILFAKNPVILPILSQLLEKRNIHRRYQAICMGEIKEKQLTLNKKIGRDAQDKRKRKIDEKRGHTAITHVHVEKIKNGQSYLTIILDTGRTHQIRVHLASLGKPILGDPLYNEQSTAPRLMLHAKELWFTHPFTKEEIQIKTLTGLF